MNILGISAYYHDSAACLVRDGVIVAAAQEERFTRKKHDYAFPDERDRVLPERGRDPRTKISTSSCSTTSRSSSSIGLLETYVERHAPQRLQALPHGACRCWLKQKLHTPREMREGHPRPKYEGRFVFTEHHESHIASAFFPSPFDEAVDPDARRCRRVGHGLASRVGRGNKIELLKELRFPHSLGLLYSAFTYFTGFKVNSGEYKLIGPRPLRRADLCKGRILDRVARLA